MVESDDFTDYYQDLLDGRYDCVDRIVLNGYFPMGQQGGGFRHWWQKLTGSDKTLTQEHLLRMAGRFSRRVHAYARKNNIPIIHCNPGVRKHDLAKQYRPAAPTFHGLFLILVAKAPALVWEVTQCKNGTPHLERKKPWPYVNHYHFHFIDKDWGHLTIKMSGHPPFGVQILLNGHEWVERQALKQTISLLKEGNCFIGCSDFQALDQIADTLCDQHAIGRLADVCDRWVYSSCLCFALDVDEQRQSEFRYRYSCYQVEYSRNMLFQRGTMLDKVYQGVIDRTRRQLDVNKLKTIFGCKKRPHHRRHDGSTTRWIQKELDASAYDITVFKVHFGRLTLKMYDKGDRVLRIEAIAHNVNDLRCGKGIEKLSIILKKLQRMTIDFLNGVCAIDLSYIDECTLSTLHQPTHRGSMRLAGVDMQNPRICQVSNAVLALSAKPSGFTAKELAEKICELMGDNAQTHYTPRQAAYDLRKFRGKNLVERLQNTRNYCCKTPGIRTLAGLLILREKVIKPVLAGTCKNPVGRPPKNPHQIDKHYENIQREILSLFEIFGLAA